MSDLDQRQEPLPPARRFLNSMQQMAGMLKDVIPGAGTAESFIAQAYIYAKHNPKILNCTEASLANTLMACAQTGLNLNPQGNLAHIVPFKGQAQLIIGYQGYIDLMFRCAGVIDVDPQIVYVGDEFEYERGTRPYIKHRPHWQDRLGDASEEHRQGPVEIPAAAYCIISFRNGFKKFEVLHKYQIERIRDGIRHYKKNDPDHMWNKNTIPMWRKTAIRATVKYVPHTPQLALAMDLDRRYEDGEEQIVDVGLEEEIRKQESKPTKAERVEDEIKTQDAEWGVFGARITKFRVDSGLSTYKTAEILKLDEEQLFEVESGAKYEPRDGDKYENLTNFASACGVDVGELLDLLPE